ncbi:MAG: hypothetical protein GEU28_14945, partial [Dehalococcoidia bacterium]|nr:hypothetical protein [Dehalococcoidia bacterium]
PDSCDELNIIEEAANYGWPLARVSSEGCDRADGVQAIHYFATDGKEAHETLSTVGPSSLVYPEGGFGDLDGPGLVVCEVNTGRLVYLELNAGGEKVVAEELLAENCFTDVIEVDGGDHLVYAAIDGIYRLSAN